MFQGGGQILLMGDQEVLIGVLANEAVESVVHEALIRVGASAEKQSLSLFAFRKVELGRPERVGGFGHRQLATLRPHGVLGEAGPEAHTLARKKVWVTLNGLVDGCVALFPRVASTVQSALGIA